MNMKLKFFIVSVCCLWIFQGIVQAQSMYGDAVQFSREEDETGRVCGGQMA